ncbi:MAG: hypothetical protein ACOZAA_09775, partial [Pseudomonadota bacterium]
GWPVYLVCFMCEPAQLALRKPEQLFRQHTMATLPRGVLIMKIPAPESNHSLGSEFSSAQCGNR